MIKYIFAFLLPITLASSALASTHTVKHGESLWKIAKQYYGTGYRWRRIYDANRDRISNSNHIRPGQILRIPDTDIVAPAGYVLWKVIKRAKITAYEPSARSCYPFADGRTSTGRNAWIPDGCAVDPRVIPYGTLIDIPGIGLRKADDTGSAMKRSTRRGVTHIDARMVYRWQAIQWGVRRMTVKLYRRI